VSWWEIAIVVYFAPFPLPQIMTWAAIAVYLDERKTRKGQAERQP